MMLCPTRLAHKVSSVSHDAIISVSVSSYIGLTIGYFNLLQRKTVPAVCRSIRWGKIYVIR